MEHATVLDVDTDAPALLLDPLDVSSVLLAPFGAVSEQHVGALGLLNGDAVEVLVDVIAGPVDVGTKNLDEVFGDIVKILGE